ncbi:MAG: hypothetical protein RL885_07130 [Planctomycetota bacterium]
MRHLEVMPLSGIGRLRFGHGPADVRGYIGEEEVVEPWMAGDLRAALTFSGLIFFFDRYDRRGPTKDARLVEIQVHQRSGLRLFERPLESWTRDELIQELTEQRVAWSTCPEADILIDSMSLQISFNGDVAGFVAIWEPEMADVSSSDSDRPWWKVWG